jgi:uncharacterized protein YbaA (DUF1428 family)
MAKYVDGFLLPISAENIKKYTEIAQKAGEVWKEHGALEYIEAVGDDFEADKMISFKKSADATEGETVIFAFIIFESKEERDRINALVMADERLQEMCSPDDNIFDYTRMSYGGFQVLVEA